MNVPELTIFNFNIIVIYISIVKDIVKGGKKAHQ